MSKDVPLHAPEPEPDNERLTWGKDSNLKFFNPDGTPMKVPEETQPVVHIYLPPGFDADLDEDNSADMEEEDEPDDDDVEEDEGDEDED